jgi:arsenical pump membrane protein
LDCAGIAIRANLTPIGALAGIMWMTILSGKEVRISFVEFVKYGLLVTPASLLACLAVLALQLMVGM